MNSYQVKGAAKEAIGTMQKRVGKMVGSKAQIAKGVARQVEGKIQRGIGNVREAMAHAAKK